MKARLVWAQGVGVLLLLAAAGAARPADRARPSPTDKIDPRLAAHRGEGEPGPAAREARLLAEKIDQHLARRQAAANAEPAPPADDAELLRRACLDLAGRIPSVEQTRTFLDDKRPDKRARLVEQLLAGPRYAAHFANVWRAVLLPEADNNFLVQAQEETFKAWLKRQLARNAGYDAMVRELLTYSFGSGGGIQSLVGLGDAGPQAYYFAKEFKPENLAAGTARVFLGVSVECAQCHNHPFADWKREQFWGLAAFFSGLKSRRTMDVILPDGDDADKHELTIPGTGKVIRARFLDGKEPQWTKKAASRATLAAWVTAHDNPYFARAAVNRLWAYFLGTGLVEPVDEMVGSNSTSSHPELLDLLARELAAHEFDLKFLIRALTATRAYQLSSAREHKGPDDPTLFTRMPLRGLTAEQLFDSVAMATGYRDSGGGNDLLTGLLGGNRSARAEFLTRFAASERPTEAQTSILQALSLMNGKVTAAATTLERSETLAAVADAPFLSTADRVETLYLAALSRKPSTREGDRAVRFVQEAAGKARGSDAVRRATGEALADLFWALLNSPEFVVNH
jgi:hypothetical protein